MPRFPRGDAEDGLSAVTSTVIQGRLGGRFFCVHLVGVTLQVVARPCGGGKRLAGCRVCMAANPQEAVTALGRPCAWGCCQGLNCADRGPGPQ